MEISTIIKTNVVKTERLNIYPLSNCEMENMIVIELDMDMKKAYSEMLDGCKQKPEQRIWYAVWNMQLNDETGKSTLSYMNLKYLKLYILDKCAQYCFLD